MVETILEILLTGSKIFSEERQRYFEKKLYEANKAVKDAENARHPDYNDAKLMLAKEELDALTLSYAKEFKEAMAVVLAKAGQNA